MMPCAILAGGLATRLGTLTEQTPKSLLPIGGEPFIAHQLRLLRDGGIAKAVLCVGHLGSKIREFVGDGATFGLDVEYSEDGARPLGTAGAIRQALPRLGGAFFTLYGDSYLTCDYPAVARAFQQSEQPALMTVFANDGQWDRSNVEFRSGRIVQYSKSAQTPEMRHIDYGLGAFRRSAFASVPDGYYDLSNVYQNLVVTGEVAAFEVRERFYEIGSVGGIEELTALLAAKQPGKQST
jgi:NDP-sugar pyrophosphorylase family protein